MNTHFLNCPFCEKIERGRDEHGFVYDTNVHSIKRFVPLNPVTPGHMLFVPDTHFEKAEKGNLATAEAFIAAVAYAREAGVENYNLIQSNGAPATQTVPHVHVHLVPRSDGDGLPLPWDTQISGETSDGFHTFNELYEARMLYHASAVKHWMNEGHKVYKSKRHSDGGECFGGGWFIVVAELPAGQVSQHYPMKDWDLFEVPAVTRAHYYDNHTNDDVLARLGDQLARERYL